MASATVGVMVGLAVAGCAGDEADDRGPSGERPAAETATSSPQRATPPAELSTRRPGAERVSVVDFDYEPGSITVEAGGRVTWVNRDTSNHTVTFATKPGDLGNLDPKRSRSARFTKPGRYAYVCQYHPSMAGTVTVE